MKARNISLDYLKLLFSFFIVALHSGFLGGLNNLCGYLFINGLFRIAVPTFFMINGYFLYRIIDNSQKVKKYLKHIFVMYIAWMILYLPLYYSAYELGSLKDILRFVIMLLNGYAHLWYLVGLLGAVIIIYITKNINQNKKLIFAILLYFLGSTIDYYSLIYTSNTVIYKIISNNYFTRNFLFLAFPFVFLGYYIVYMQYKKIKLISKITNLKFIVLLGFILLFIEAYLDYNYIPQCKERGKDFLFSLIIIAPALFLVFSNKKTVEVNSDFISKVATGIYFVHIAIQFILIKYFDYFYGSLRFTIVSLLASIIMSILLLRSHTKIRKVLL